jgi:chitin disaccharide deacetylase
MLLMKGSTESLPGARIEVVSRGDDAGMTVGTNQAIAECFERGLLRNTSVMAVGPEVEHSAKMLSRLGLCCGLHITLNSEWGSPRYRPILPAREVPSLVDGEGCFLPAPVDLHQRGFDLDEAMAEVAAQYERLRDAGFDLRYLDEHMGVGWLPGLRERFATFAAERGLLAPDGGVCGLPKAAGETADRVEQWIARLRAAQPGTRYVLITHPAHGDSTLQAFTRRDGSPAGIAADRDADRAAWIDPRLAQAAEESGVRFVRYDEQALR